MLEWKIKAKILKFPTSSMCHRHGCASGHQGPTVLVKYTMYFCCSAACPSCVIQMYSSVDHKINGHRFLESSASHGYMTQDCQAISGCPHFVLTMHIKRYWLRSRCQARLKKPQWIISNKPCPKPMNFCFGFKVQCGEVNPAFQSSNS